MDRVFKSIVPVQIRFSDVDSLGHVSNTQYQNYYDLGKVDYFDKVIPDMDFRGLCVVGASVKIDYLLPVFLDTHVQVKTRIAAVGNKSITMEHQLVDSADGTLYSTCTAVVVCYDVRTSASVAVPEEWRERIHRFEND